jgi:hypothetical protein
VRSLESIVVTTILLIGKKFSSGKLRFQSLLASHIRVYYVNAVGLCVAKSVCLISTDERSGPIAIGMWGEKKSKMNWDVFMNNVSAIRRIVHSGHGFFGVRYLFMVRP